MKTLFQKNWWFLTLNGVLLIIFGLLAVFNPKTTIENLMKFFGIVIIIAGVIFIILGSISSKEKKKNILLLAAGILNVILGILIMVFPESTLQITMRLIGIWAILVGLYQLISYLGMSKEQRSNSLYLLSCFFSIILGLIMIFVPLTTAAFITILIGLFALAAGIFLLMASFGIRKALKAKGE
jgi:uncharacterized membrane protein HdeD (DUF308 family)